MRSCRRQGKGVLLSPLKALLMPVPVMCITDVRCGIMLDRFVLMFMGMQLALLCVARDGLPF